MPGIYEQSDRPNMIATTIQFITKDIINIDRDIAMKFNEWAADNTDKNVVTFTFPRIISADPMQPMVLNVSMLFFYTHRW